MIDAEPNSELTFAVVATPEETFIALARLGINHLIHIAGFAMMALRLAFPEPSFKKLNCRQFI
jgi:hypothetical protein